MREYVQKAINVIGIAVLLYFTPLMFAILDFYVFKTKLLQQAPSWVETAFLTVYEPILPKGCQGHW